MEISKHTLKRILLAIAFTLTFYWSLNHLSQVMGLVMRIVSILSPIIIGLAFAFVANVLLRIVEKGWDWASSRAKPKKKTAKWPEKLKRPVCLVLTLIAIIGVILALFFIVVPELEQTINMLIDSMPQYISRLDEWWVWLTEFCAKYSIVLPQVDLDTDKILDAAAGLLKDQGHIFLDKTVDITTSIFSGIFNLVLAFVFCIYVLAQKEKLGAQVRKMIYALLPEKKSAKLLEICTLSNRTFTSFVTGQLIEAVIIAVLCLIGMLIFRMPYAYVISVLVGFTALIPVFGAFIGTAVGAFLILLVSPIKALWFIVFIIVLQQLEGNLIYPRVVGKSVGLPGIWVLAAVTIGGNAFGFLGMLLSVPVSSVLYALFRQYINARTDKKKANAQIEMPPTEVPGVRKIDVKQCDE